MGKIKNLEFGERVTKENKIEICEAYLVEYKTDKEVHLVFVVSYEGEGILFINGNGSLSYGNVDYLKRDYNILKKVTDKITIKVEE